MATWKPPPRALASGLPHAAVRKTLQTYRNHCAGHDFCDLRRRGNLPLELSPVACRAQPCTKHKVAKTLRRPRFGAIFVHLDASRRGRKKLTRVAGRTNAHAGGQKSSKNTAKATNFATFGSSRAVLRTSSRRSKKSTKNDAKIALASGLPRTPASARRPKTHRFWHQLREAQDDPQKRPASPLEPLLKPSRSWWDYLK